MKTVKRVIALLLVLVMTAGLVACGGGMEPIAASPDARHGFIIYHRCTKCGEIRRNKAAYGAKNGADSLKLLIELTARPQP